MELRATEISAIGRWNPTVQQVRDAVLEFRITVPDFRETFRLSAEALACQPSEMELEAVCHAAHSAVTAGRMIFFGHWTNPAIQKGGNRGGPLWNQGVLAVPFSQPWMFLHTWNPTEANDAEEARRLGLDPRSASEMAVYLVVPPPPQSRESTWLCELLPQDFDGMKLLELGDRAVLHVETSDLAKYTATTAPAVARWVVAEHATGERDQVAAAAASNVIDPLMLALLILNTRGVERRTVVPSAKLNKARRKVGKYPIPPYDEVFSEPYITALTATRARARGEDQGGTHKHPTPHVRMGHVRHYQSGIVALIQDTLVNVPAEQRAAWKQGRRSHYEVRS